MVSYLLTLHTRSTPLMRHVISNHLRLHLERNEMLPWQKKKLEPNKITLAKWVDKAL